MGAEEGETIMITEGDKGLHVAAMVHVLGQEAFTDCAMKWLEVEQS